LSDIRFKNPETQKRFEAIMKELDVKIETRIVNGNFFVKTTYADGTHKVTVL
jgi:hypothetical protein